MEIEPAWVIAIIGVGNLIFGLGVFIGGFLPLKRQVEKLADKIEATGIARENQTAALVEIKTVVAGVQEEIRRIRDARHEDNTRTMGVMADVLSKLEERR